MSLIFRFFSLVLIVIALMLLGADIVTSLEKGQVTVRSIEQVWTLLDAGSLHALKDWAGATLPRPLPNWIYSLLSMWAFGVVGVFGVVLAFVSGRHHPGRVEG